MWLWWLSFLALQWLQGCNASWVLACAALAGFSKCKDTNLFLYCGALFRLQGVFFCVSSPFMHMFVVEEALGTGMMVKRYWQAFAKSQFVMNVYKGGAVNPCLPFGNAQRAVPGGDMARLATQNGLSRIARQADSLSCWLPAGYLAGFSRWHIYVFSLQFFIPGIWASAVVSWLTASAASLPSARSTCRPWGSRGCLAPSNRPTRRTSWPRL